MTKEKKLFRLWKPCAISLLIMSCIFVGIYLFYIFGQFFYAYSHLDIGSDTVTTYLPNIVYDIRNILGGSNNVFSLQRGLGEFYAGASYKYFNLVNTPLLLFGEEHLQLGLMVSLYLKYAVICVFSVFFFERILKEPYGACICALLWTFSGFSVLWGQHYNYLTSMVFFTIAMYGIQLFLEDDRKRFLLIPALAGLAFTSYFCLYTSCYFFAVYSILWLVFHKAGIVKILKKAGAFAIALLLAAGIAGVAIVPALSNFFDSSRVSNVTQVNIERPFYESKFLLTFLGRLLSNNIWGVGRGYVGPRNYYEVAILSVSVMFIFSFVLMLQSPLRKRVIVIVASTAVVLCMPFFSQLFAFAPDGQRWTYFLCFAEVLLIGIAMRYMFAHYQEPDFRVILRRTIIIADGIYIAILFLLWLMQSESLDLHFRYSIYVIVCLLVYSVFFLLLPRWKKKHGYVVLAVLVVVELVAMNFDTVNQRIKITGDDWYHSMYYDSTQDAIDWLRQQDDTLYRINKTYNSVGYNDSLIQGYNGVEVYNSTNTAELIAFYTGLDYSMISDTQPNWVHFSAQDDVMNALLNVKYIIARPDDELNCVFYKEVYADEEHVVYENQVALGFGYLYKNQISRQEFEAIAAGRKQVLTQSYYLSNEEIQEGVDLPPVQVPGDSSENCFDYLRGAKNCDVDFTDGVLQITGTGEDDIQLYFDWPELPEGCSVNKLTVRMTSEKDSYIQLFIIDKEGRYSEEQSYLKTTEVGEQEYVFDGFMTYDGLTEFRIDPSAVSQNITIQSVELQLTNSTQLRDNLQMLEENSMKDITQDGNTFTGTITNPWEEDAMLCIPLIYSNHWRAMVDGETVTVESINGGLVGIKLNPGYHEISITYYDNSPQIGQAISWMTFVLYLTGTILWWKRKGRYETPICICESEEE